MNTGAVNYKQSVASPWKIFILLAGAVFITTFVIFQPALHNQFVNWDDNQYVYDNIHIRTLDTPLIRWAFVEFYAANWHPLTWLSHALDFAVWGLNPYGHHLTSIVIHSLNSFLVTILGIQLFTHAPMLYSGTHDNNQRKYQVAAAVLAGILFGIHPIQVESVAWISERKNVLCSFFFLLCLLFYLNYSLFQKIKYYTITLSCFILALLCKPMAVSLPFILLIIDWLPLSRTHEKSRTTLIIEKVPFIIASAASSYLTVIAQHSGDAIVALKDNPLADRLIVGCLALCSYVMNILVPQNLVPIYSFPQDISLISIKYLFPIFFVTATTVYCLATARHNRIWLAVWGSYIIMLLPVLGIVRVGRQFMADRYAYLPSIGIYFLISIGIIAFYRKVDTHHHVQLPWRISTWIFVILSICTLSFLTNKQIAIWKNGTVFWNYVIIHEPRFALAHNSLGIINIENHRINEAISNFETALNIEPTNIESLNNLAICLFDQKFYDKAEFYAKRAVSLKVRNASACSTLGEIALAREEYSKANSYFMQAITFDSGSPVRYYNLAYSFEKIQKIKEACMYWGQYLAIGTDAVENRKIGEHMKEIGCYAVK